MVDEAFLPSSCLFVFTITRKEHQQHQQTIHTIFSVPSIVLKCSIITDLRTSFIIIVKNSVRFTGFCVLYPLEERLQVLCKLYGGI